MGDLVGYVGRREAAPVLLKGLNALGCRGHSSAELAILNGGTAPRRAAGRIPGLESQLCREPIQGTCGLAHASTTASTAAASEVAGRPSACCTDLALFHTGLIENGDALRALLERGGHVFDTGADAELLAHLVEDAPGETLEERVSGALERVEGTWSLVAASGAEPGKIVVARDGAPALLGIGEGECFVASDASGILAHTRTVVYLSDGDVAAVTRDGYRVVRQAAVPAAADADIDAALDEIERGGHAHFMRQEIFEQPGVIERALRGRVSFAEGTARFDDAEVAPADLDAVQRVVIVGTGSAWHAALLGRHVIEVLARVPVEVEHASEYRYAPRRAGPGTLTIALSRSGENADTVQAECAARAAGSRVVAIVNTVASTIAREADGRIYLHAGPELGVASTKFFTAAMVTLLLLGLELGRRRGLSPEAGRKFLDRLFALPGQVAEALALEPQIRAAAERCTEARNALVLGRGLNYPVALEGALKLVEVGHMHAEGHSALETRHGPVQLVTSEAPVVFLAPRDEALPKVLSSMHEVRSRGGWIIAIANGADGGVRDLADHHWRVPATPPLLAPVVNVVPLQLLAYHVAVLRGHDVDRREAQSEALAR